MTEKQNKLFVIWASADVEVHEETSFQYTFNANKYKWFDEVKVVIFGPSERTIPEHPNMMAKMQQLVDSGIEVVACRVCSERYDTVTAWEKVGVKVDYVGTSITQMLKDGWYQLSF